MHHDESKGKGNVQLDDNKKPIEDKDATTTVQNANKDAWGKSLGAGNTISNSYRDVTSDPIEVLTNRHDPEALRKRMKDAVKERTGHGHGRRQ